MNCENTQCESKVQKLPVHETFVNREGEVKRRAQARQVTDLRWPPGPEVLSTGCSTQSPGRLSSVSLSETPELIFIMSGGDAECLVPCTAPQFSR